VETFHRSRDYNQDPEFLGWRARELEKMSIRCCERLTQTALGTYQ
jgi:hypothetical protein